MKLFIFIRTALVVLVLGLMYLAALLICARYHLGAEYAQHSKECFTALATAAVCHGSISHLAGDGGGLIGAAKALFTKAKPEGAEQPQ